MDRRPSLLGQKQVGVRKYSATAFLTGDDSGMAMSNEGASGSITLNLPKANPGYEFRFLVVNAQTMTIHPNAADSYRGKGAGISLAYATPGGLLKIICIRTGVWEIEYNIGPFA